MRRFRVTGKYEVNAEPLSLVIPAEHEDAARHRTVAEGIQVQEVQPDNDAAHSATLPDTLLYVGFAGAVLTCFVMVVFASIAFFRGNVLDALVFFPLGFIMAAANAMLFWRVIDLSARVFHEK